LCPTNIITKSNKLFAFETMKKTSSGIRCKQVFS
jgi:hypothetical protein